MGTSMQHPLDQVEEDSRSLYDRMLAFSTEARWYVVSPGMVAPCLTLRSREELIADLMVIPHYTPYKDPSGHAQFGEPRYLTREEAEYQIGAYRQDVAA